jgi:hypothetical protein
LFILHVVILEIYPLLVAAAAQEPAPVEHQDFKKLRYDEDYAYLADPGGAPPYGNLSSISPWALSQGHTFPWEEKSGNVTNIPATRFGGRTLRISGEHSSSVIMSVPIYILASIFASSVS